MPEFADELEALTSLHQVVVAIGTIVFATFGYRMYRAILGQWNRWDK